MKELMKKIIEAGLVPKHTLQMMERWKMVDPRETCSMPSQAELENRTKAQLQAFAEEISELLEDTTLPEMRETDLVLAHMFKEQPFQVSVDILTGAQRLNISGLAAVKMRDGHVVLRRTGCEQYIETAARPGNFINCPGGKLEIRSVEVRYLNDVPEFYVCSVMKVSDAEV